MDTNTKIELNPYRKDGDKEYFFLKLHPKKKFFKVVVYEEKRYPISEYLTTDKVCNCPAGHKGILCKHRRWVNEIIKEEDKS